MDEDQEEDALGQTVQSEEDPHLLDDPDVSQAFGIMLREFSDETAVPY